MNSPPRSGHRLWVRRLGWLILIWTLSVIALGVVAALLRTLMNIAGLTV
jgi:Protein of unknown function (DUF2474)